MLLEANEEMALAMISQMCGVLTTMKRETQRLRFLVEEKDRMIAEGGGADGVLCKLCPLHCVREGKLSGGGCRGGSKEMKIRIRAYEQAYMKMKEEQK